MRLIELVAADRIDTGLRATDKHSVLEVLGRLLGRGTPAISPAAITKVLEDREVLASTGVGDEVAIPHGRMGGIDRVVAALAFSDEGVDFDAIDRQPVRIFVAILAPEKDTTGHLKALARFSRILRDARVRAQLLAERDPARVLAILESEAAASGC
ncbi:MAG: PTS sugar transporter subunit IIA [Myxococcales bacterium]|nr:PTS sugar transporter subunit IIA [Myxococcales bacterium]